MGFKQSEYERTDAGSSTNKAEDSRKCPENPELILCPVQATQLLLQVLALYLNFLWLPQKLMAPLGGIGLVQPETLTESSSEAFANATDELRVNDKWNVVDKAVQTN